MPESIFSAEVVRAFNQMKMAVASGNASKNIMVNGASVNIPYPFPSPADWRNHWIYFLMADRFNNPLAPPNRIWNENFTGRQGGTINGIRAQLNYIASLGARVIWISPLMKNAATDNTSNYHGYAVQDFLTIDGRFGSDGSAATAEKELVALVEEAHARGIYVIMDIIINHTAGSVANNNAIFPDDLQHDDFFRTQIPEESEETANDKPLAIEYKTTQEDQKDLRKQYGTHPVLNILIQAYRYMIARFDIDGFRIDTVKDTSPDIVETFTNAIREFALSSGKHNFFTFGKIDEDEKTLQPFIGRHSNDGYGIDAALDYPLFFILPQVVKSQIPAETIQKVFTERKEREKKLLSSHGEAGRFFVSFLDNHDQYERFNHTDTPAEQVLAGLVMLFCLQGIPCLYYGTEQGLQGTVHAKKEEDRYENVREALWGKTPKPFDTANPLYTAIKKLSHLRQTEPALKYGRLYFREISGNGIDFDFSTGIGGIVAFSRILADREILVVVNTHTTDPFKGFVVMDADSHRGSTTMKVSYSNYNTEGRSTVQLFAAANFMKDQQVEKGETAALYIELAPMEAQVLVPL